MRPGLGGRPAGGGTKKGTRRLLPAGALTTVPYLGGAPGWEWEWCTRADLAPTLHRLPARPQTLQYDAGWTQIGSAVALSITEA